MVGQAMYQVHEGQVRWDLQHSMEIEKEKRSSLRVIILEQISEL